MTELETTFNEFKKCVKGISYETLPINELANKYCEATDNHNENERNIYFSALVLRFWYKIHKLYTENITLNLSYTDYFDWITGAILMACSPENRIWQKDDKLNAQQVINKILATRFVAAAYYDSNLQKNAGKHTEISLDETIDDDETHTLLETIPDETFNSFVQDEQVVSLIQDYVKRNKIIEAIIFDTIANKDICKHSKKIVKTKDSEGNIRKHTEHSSEFWPFKVIQELGKLPTDYEAYFLTTYTPSRKAFEAAFKALKKSNNQKRYKMLGAALKDLRAYYNTNMA